MDRHVVLPASWQSVEVGGAHYLCGFSECGSGQGAYSFYATNMVSVWAHRPSEKDVKEQAVGSGILDFGPDKLASLSASLGQAFASHSVEYSMDSRTFCATAKLSDSLTWRLDASICDDQFTAFFFRRLCAHSLHNQGLLLYRASQMERMLRSKQKYITYLEENYKSVNGSELMDKYRRQHPDEVGYLKNFDRGLWNESVAAEFGDLMESHDFWSVASTVVSDRSTWEKSMPHQLGMESARIETTSDKGARIKSEGIDIKTEGPESEGIKTESVKTEGGSRKRSRSPESAEPQIKREKVELPPPSPQKKTPSPRRRRIGLLRR